MTDAGCENGHPMSCLRNVQETDSLPGPVGSAADRPANSASASDPAAVPSVTGPLARLSARPRGAVILVIGLVLAKWQIYDPLNARELGLSHVFVSPVLVVFAVLALFMGTVYVAFGDRADAMLRFLRVEPKNLSGKGIAAVVLAILLFVAFIFLVLAQLYGQGYR